MEERKNLNEQDLEDVVGGAFKYKEDDEGNCRCKVDNIGIYNCVPNAKGRIMKYMAQYEFKKSAQEIVDWALSQGIFW